MIILDKINWAPLNVPLHRRLETASTLLWMCIILIGEFISIGVFLKLLYSDYYIIALAYLYWLLNDIDVCNKGGRRFEWVRNWICWEYFRDYFPIKLVKTADLNPEKNYIFACYPHGVVATGSFTSFMTNAVGFKQLFPGMKSHLITLSGHFLVPFFRDLILAAGSCSSSYDSLNYLLDPKNGKGRCVCLLVGGAAEAINAQPGQYKVVLKDRRGFIRLALQNGSDLVPVFSFGEPDVFTPLSNPENSRVRRFQEWFKRITGIAPVLPLGRGIFQYSIGFLPIRKPVTTVVGSPIEVKKSLEPTTEEVETLHKKFTEKLIQLFESEKSKYLTNYKDTHLVIA